jgi:hypothetical protein
LGLPKDIADDHGDQVNLSLLFAGITFELSWLMVRLWMWLTAAESPVEFGSHVMASATASVARVGLAPGSRLEDAHRSVDG